MSFLLEILPIISTILFGILACVLIFQNEDLRRENEILKETMLEDEFKIMNKNRKLEKALHNAIKECCYSVRDSGACNDLDALYEAVEKKVWDNVK